MMNQTVQGSHGNSRNLHVSSTFNHRMVDRKCFNDKKELSVVIQPLTKEEVSKILQDYGSDPIVTIRKEVVINNLEEALDCKLGYNFHRLIKLGINDTLITASWEGELMVPGVKPRGAFLFSKVTFRH